MAELCYIGQVRTHDQKKCRLDLNLNPIINVYLLKFFGFVIFFTSSTFILYFFICTDVCCNVNLFVAAMIFGKLICNCLLNFLSGWMFYLLLFICNCIFDFDFLTIVFLRNLKKVLNLPNNYAINYVTVCYSHAKKSPNYNNVVTNIYSFSIFN